MNFGVVPRFQEGGYNPMDPKFMTPAQRAGQLVTPKKPMMGSLPADYKETEIKAGQTAEAHRAGAGFSSTSTVLSPKPTDTSTGIIDLFSNLMGPFAQMFDVLKPLGLGMGNAMTQLMGGVQEMKEANKDVATTISSSGNSSSPTLTGSTREIAKEMYDYMRGLGVSDIHAKGMLANIQGESGFKIDAIGDGGSSGGLFQMHGVRFDRMAAAVPNWKTDWQGQIRHAIQDDRAPEYLNKGFKNGVEAADWFLHNYERPAMTHRPGREQLNRTFIPSLGFQQGGMVSRKPIIPKMQAGGLVSGTDNKMNLNVSQSKYSTHFNAVSTVARNSGVHDKNQAPIVINNTAPAPSAQTSATSNPSAPPNLSAYPNTAVAIDYMYRATMGSLLS
jgi:hypothetical protein